MNYCNDIYRFLLILIILSSSIVGKSQLPVIPTVINEVSIDTLIGYAKDITGERSVIIKGVINKINSRHKNYPGNELAFQYILQKLASYGLKTDSLLFGTKGKNALAIQPGNVYPNQYYIICAHYDAMPSTSIAPGAEDNASGVVTVLEAARVLSKYKFEYTIIYALWDEEEQGLLGSQAYAAKAFANNDPLKGVINLDMVGWDGNADNLARIASKNISTSFKISDSIVAVNNNYNIGLNFITKIPLASGNSDQASFWDKGFGAVHVIEDFENDRSPHYHKSSDSVKYLTLPYFTKMAKLVIASTATLAVPVKTLGTEGKLDLLSLNFYPNPTSGMLTIESENKILIDAKISLYSILGEELMTLAGKANNTSLDLTSYPKGMYFLRINKDKGIITKKIIVDRN